jgi:hypothetical protein
MKLAVIGHVPRKDYGNPAVFLRNLEKFPPKHTLLLYSAYDWPNVTPLKASPDILKNQPDAKGNVNKWAANNASFLTGLRIAKTKGFTHVLYLEEDCRVGVDGWDEIMFEEYFECRRPLVAAGSLVCWNPCNHSGNAARRWEKLIATNTRKNYPIPTYGWLPAAVQANSCVFPNGALGIYDMAWMSKLWDLDNTRDESCFSTAWDQELGNRIWKVFAEDSYEVLAHLTRAFSGYGDVITTEPERQKMLSDGEVVAVHQIKSAWEP